MIQFMEIFMLDTCTCTSTTSVCPIFSSYGDIFIQYHLKKTKKNTHTRMPGKQKYCSSFINLQQWYNYVVITSFSLHAIIIHSLCRWSGRMPIVLRSDTFYEYSEKLVFITQVYHERNFVRAFDFCITTFKMLVFVSVKSQLFNRLGFF